MAILYTLLLLIALLCSSAYLFGPIAAIFILCVVLLISDSDMRNSIIRGLLVAAAIGFGLLTFVFTVLPSVITAHECARNLQCQNNMKQIAQALLCYREMKKRFPPAHTDGEKGKPMHSWRVLISPCLGRKDLYEAYDFNEPWDGPNNIKLIDQSYSIFVCPSDGKMRINNTLTSYVAYVAPGTVWANGSTDRGNGPSVMLVETLGSDIKWTEPRDFVFSAGNNGDSEEQQPTIGSNHKHPPGFLYHDMPAVHVAFSDGGVYLVPTAILSDGNIPRINGQSTEEAVNHWIAEHRRVHWPHIIGLAVWVVSLVLLIHWSVRCKNIAQRRTAVNAKSNADADRAGEE